MPVQSDERFLTRKIVKSLDLAELTIVSAVFCAVEDRASEREHGEASMLGQVGRFSLKQIKADAAEQGQLRSALELFGPVRPKEKVTKMGSAATGCQAAIRILQGLCSPM
jgi:hypothetical protein